MMMGVNGRLNDVTVLDETNYGYIDFWQIFQINEISKQIFVYSDLNASGIWFLLDGTDRRYGTPIN